MLSRHAQALSQWRQGRTSVQQSLNRLQAGDPSVLPVLQRQLNPRKALAFNPKQLPFSSPSGKSRQPEVSPERLKQRWQGKLPSVVSNNPRQAITPTELAALQQPTAYLLLKKTEQYI